MSDESSKFAEIEKSKMANSTPSSVLNELAKSNKVVALYQVVAESGPSHQKTYQVHLHIGVHGPYEGIGSNLKSARNAAASKALADGLQSLYLNPTVELNILSMKSGEQVVYKELTTSLPQQKVENFFVPHQFIQRDQRARVKCVNKLWKMSVTLCGRTYIGEGQTKSEARGNTASRALSELKPLLLEKAKRAELERLQQKITVNHEIDSSNVTYKSNSFVSDLYEKAVQHNFVIHFTTIHESGPPHVRFFHIKCIVGEKETVGEGVGKKNAKNNAAEKMLKVLEDSALLSSKNKEKKQFKKKVEEKKVNVALNPITYLTQLMQLRKEPPVIYVTKADMGPHQPGDMRFQIEASIADFKSIGYGSTKKVAKANAAMNLLKNLGIDLDEMKESQLQKAKNVSFLPEVSLVKDINDKFSASIKPHGSPVVLGRSLNLNTLARLENFDSAKQKLEYIAQLEGFQLLFNDFVKNKKDNRGEFSSHLAIFTTPPELYQGSGDSVESSRENAASKALKAMFKNVEKTEEAAP